MENYGSREQFIKDLKAGVFADMVKEEMVDEKFNNSKEVYNTLKPMVSLHDDVEKLYVIFLDAKNGVIDIDPMFSGSILESSVYIREIVKAVIQKKAVSIILAHNHPSGDSDPSSEDRLITRRTQFALHCIRGLRSSGTISYAKEKKPSLMCLKNRFIDTIVYNME